MILMEESPGKPESSSWKAGKPGKPRKALWMETKRIWWKACPPAGKLESLESSLLPLIYNILLENIFSAFRIFFNFFQCAHKHTNTHTYTHLCNPIIFLPTLFVRKLNLSYIMLRNLMKKNAALLSIRGKFSYRQDRIGIVSAKRMNKRAYQGNSVNVGGNFRYFHLDLLS